MPNPDIPGVAVAFVKTIYFIRDAAKASARILRHPTRPWSATWKILADSMTPRIRLNLLLYGDESRVKITHWEIWRNGLTRKWKYLIIICGLVTTAVSSVLFGNYGLSSSALAAGVVSLLSSLICIGYGAALIYVLGDAPGSILRSAGTRYPILFVTVLSIPQLWGGIAFSAFFISICIIGFQATDKGPLLEMGMILTIVVLVGHLIAFLVLFRSVPEPEVFDEGDLQQHP